MNFSNRSMDTDILCKNMHNHEKETSIRFCHHSFGMGISYVYYASNFLCSFNKGFIPFVWTQILKVDQYSIVQGKNETMLQCYSWP